MRAFSRFHRHLGNDSLSAGGTTAVIFALAAGTVAAMAKTAAAVLTGSASMLAAAMHSWVDTAAECFLIAAYFAARRPADEKHRLGYGRDSYVWTLFASIVMVIVGAEVGVWRGITQLSAPDTTTDYRFGYVVIAISFVLEGASFIQATRFVRRRAAERHVGIFAHVLATSDSQLRAVFTEDLIALVGLGVAALGMALHQITGNVRFDAAGSILIGLLMGLAGVLLINLNRQFLAGAPLSAEQRAMGIRLLKDTPEIERVTLLFAEFIGPDRILLAAHVSLAGDHTQAELARTLRSLEQRIMTHKNVGQAVLTLAAPEEEEIDS
ncbi:MAG: cation diffusion facilitator family transporter [Caldimonas sp.]